MQTALASRAWRGWLALSLLWICLAWLTGCGVASESGPNCVLPQVDCGGACVDPTSDTANCGQCSRACAAGEVCGAGTCSNPCGAGQGSCNGECVSLMSDARYCGTCEQACQPGEFCMGGLCSAVCNFTVCETPSGPQCADVSSNALHCGQCGQPCGESFQCVAGSCLLQCAAPLSACNNTECADLQTSVTHCGMCNVACPEGSFCQAGQCACAAPLTLCTDQCADLMTSNDHCGTCNTPCLLGRVCMGGQCVCPAGQMLCGDQCTDVLTNAEHCGACDSPCFDDYTCAAGQCVGPDGCFGSAHDVSISEVAIYQTVKIPLFAQGQAVMADQRNADVVVDRDAIVRVFVEPGAAFAARELSARVRITDSAGMTQEFFERIQISGASTDDDVDSTFNVTVPRAAISDGATYSVEVVECVAGEGTALSPRFPSEGEAELGARTVGSLKIHLVPVQYNGILPDTSDAAITYYREYFEAMYPITALEFTVGDPVDGGDFPGLDVMLGDVFSLRDAEGPADDVYYYGLTQPADSLETYCDGSCTLGVGFVTDVETADFRAAVGVAFEEMEMAAETFLHEVGHNHGREHAPCGNAGDLDGDYPYGGGEVGVWGFDPRDGSLLPPDFADIMGYCDDQWISDYTYQALLERIAAVNNLAQTRVLSSSALVPSRFWVLHVGPAGLQWRQPFSGQVPNVAAETAWVLDAAGSPLAQVPVYRVPMHGMDAALVFVPEPQPGWHALQLANTAIEF